MAIFRPLLRFLAAFLFVSAFITFPAPADETGYGYREGQLLVASPRITDPRFARAVIYMVNHDRSGALGLMINRGLGSGPLAEFLKGFGIDVPVSPDAKRAIRLLSGGPVEPGALFIIHSGDFKGASPLLLKGGIAVTRRIDALTALARGNGPASVLVILGYAGWGPGQLEEEIRNGDWLSAPATKALIFDRDLGTKWERASEMAGVEL